MLLDPGLQTKSADAARARLPPATPPATPRFRPRRTIADRVRTALLTLAEGQAVLMTHEETAWASITFAGTRHELVLDFAGRAACDIAEDFIANLPDHEFRIPGQLVADATVRAVEHRFAGDGERMLVTAVLLLLEEG